MIVYEDVVQLRLQKLCILNTLEPRKPKPSAFLVPPFCDKYLTYITPCLKLLLEPHFVYPICEIREIIGRNILLVSPVEMIGWVNIPRILLVKISTL